VLRKQLSFRVVEMQTINKKKLKDAVFTSLQDAIIHGDLKPGDRIVETKVAADMGVSQATVREALKDLEHLGMIEKNAHQGTYVKLIDKKELKDAYDARTILEIYTAEMAAKNISQAQLETLRGHLDNMTKAAEEGDVIAYSDYNVRFHESIAIICGNKIVVKLWQIANASLWTLASTNASKHSLKSLAARHITVLRALENRDPDEARAAIQAHLVEIRDEMIEDAQ